MRWRTYFASIGLLVAALSPSTAAAETIRITSGFFDVGTGSGPYRLVGDRRGFTLFGTISTDAAHFLPICNDSSGCVPGTVATLPHAWTGLDFPGARATLDGITYEEVNLLNGEAFAGVSFASDIALPAFNGNTAVMLRTPFTLSGGFSIWPHEGPITEETLVGSGVLTTRWFRTVSPERGPQWDIASARYDFAAAPIPEPTTLFLAGIAGAAALFGRRRRRLP